MSSEDTQYKNNVGNGLRKETKVLRNSSKAGQISKKKKKDIEFEAKELGRPLTPLKRKFGVSTPQPSNMGHHCLSGVLPPLAKGAQIR